MENSELWSCCDWRHPTSSEHIVTCFAAYNVRFEAWSVPKHLFAVVALLVLTLIPALRACRDRQAGRVLRLYRCAA